jgi:RHS repeat-associated protein
MKASGVVVYSFDGLYEITRTPGQAESHTLYFKGLYGDVFSQMTRSDAALITDASSGSKSTNSVDVATSTELLSFAKGDDFPPNSFVKGFFCEDIAGSCSQYYLKTAKYYYLQSAFRVVGIINTVEYDVFVWMMLVVVLYLVYIQSRRHRRDVARYVSTMIYAKRTLSVTPLLIVSILFTFTQCGLANGGGKKGEAPWILLASGINNDTPSVDEVPTTVNTVTPSSPNAPIGSIPPTGSGNNTNGSGGYRPSGSGGYTGGSGGSALVPVTGMYFLHPDHLGSITMITDGRGNVIAGGNNGGKSHISYKPYGEIHRTDSSGPDITRFKYTGQEEDKESGLLYYKARYYDPMVGRFLQADSVVMPQSTFGMNRYMYVEGNPVRFTDPSGHANVSHMFGQIVKHMAGGVQWASKGLQNAGKTYSNGVYGTHHNEKALTHGSAFANSVGRGLRIGFALCFPILSFIFDPAFTLGVWFTAANLIVGNVLGYGTSVHYAHGGYVIKNAPFVLPTAGITLGPFAFTGIGASKMTQQHEEGHIDQYNDWGGHEYMGRFGGSLFGQGSSWGENNADSRANTWAYDRDGLYYALALSAANKGDMSLLLAYLYWDKSSAWSKTY